MNSLRRNTINWGKSIARNRSLATTATPSSSEPVPSTSTSTSNATPTTPLNPTHYLITLLRSPLHLPKPSQATCHSLGLFHRLSSSIVPITPENAGYILKIKELVGVKSINVADLDKQVSKEWREREGEGRQGSGLMTRGEGGVIRVGSERARGEERGFKVVERR